VTLRLEDVKHLVRRKRCEVALGSLFGNVEKKRRRSDSADHDGSIRAHQRVLTGDVARVQKTGERLKFRRRTGVSEEVSPLAVEDRKRNSGGLEAGPERPRSELLDSSRYDDGKGRRGLPAPLTRSSPGKREKKRQRYSEDVFHSSSPRSAAPITTTAIAAFDFQM
jgi:hypothetical protein